MTAGDFLAALADPALPPPPGLKARPGADLARRFAVYRNNVTVTFVETLASTFPAVQRLVGEEFFSALARAYVAACPPTSPILAVAGERFAAFLATFPPVAGLPYLPDVARLEYAMLDAYHAADAEPVGAAALGAISSAQLERLVIKLHPSLRLITSNFAIVTIVTANRGAEAPPPIDADIAETALVVRSRLDVTLARVEPGFAAFVGALAAGKSLGEAVAACPAPFDLSAALVSLFSLDLVAGLEPGA